MRKRVLVCICISLMLSACGGSPVQEITTVSTATQSDTSPIPPEEDLEIRDEDPINLHKAEEDMETVVVSGCYVSTGENKARVMMESNPSTGCTWQAVTDDPAVMRVVSEDYTPYEYEDRVVGVGGLHGFNLEARKAGTASVVFTYGRTFEEGKEFAIKTMVFSVDQDGNVTLLSAADPDYPEGDFYPETGEDAIWRSKMESLKNAK